MSKRLASLGLIVLLVAGAAWVWQGESRALAPTIVTEYPPLPEGITLPHELAEADGTRHIVLHEQGDWRLTRHHPSGYVDVFHRAADGTWQRLNLALGWRRSQLPLKAVNGDDGALYLVTYDVVSNIPSGRSLKVTREGLDLYRITPDSADEPTQLAAGLPLGGFDARLFAQQRGGTVTLCAGHQCVDVAGNGAVTPWALEAMADHEIIELVFADSGHAYALTRLAYDDRTHGALKAPYTEYYLARLSAGAATITRIEGEGIPWGLGLQGGTPQLRLAKTRRDAQALLRYELGLMPFGGVMDFGANNLEGRLAWSAVYYLNGLLTLAGGELPGGAAVLPGLRPRLERELERMAELSATVYPNYLSKRYSVDREPMRVALHLGRVLQLIGRAERLGITSPALRTAKAELTGQLKRLDTTLEQARATDAGGQYLFYRKGFPFWADGANVPYNYVSGVVAGLLEVDTKNLRHAAPPMQPLPGQWRYWWGAADDGWSEADGISTNTPSYAGNQKALAHISYRSMDVSALLLLAQAGGALPKGFTPHVQGLVRDGMLYPLVNEVLAKQQAIAPLSDAAVARYGRAIAPWELQNQVWALDGLD
ncbi:MAG: hypothetical protein DI582_03760 [Azospirillum brasilense]|nr:MAG: hypothetical protein DI582_03760 [Azospirillum brasilense]